MRVTVRQRFTRDNPCPVCGGHANMPRGRGIRDYGFISNDGRWVVCTRPEYAGSLQENPAGGYSHRLHGQCRCGTAHDSWFATPAQHSRAAPGQNSNRLYTQELWGQAQPSVGSLVETYLRSRGITYPIPPTLRSHLSLRHAESDEVFPAMVAAVSTATQVPPTLTPVPPTPTATQVPPSPDPTSSSTDYFQKGNRYFDQGDYQEAIEQYDEAIRLDPQHADAYNNRGLAYRLLGQQELAERDFAKAKELEDE